MVIRAKLSFLRIAPRKVRLVAQSLVGRAVPEALSQLRFTVKRSSQPLLKLISSAVASASRKDLKPEQLFIKNVLVNEGPKLKRYRPRAFGRAAVIYKRSSHVTVILTDDQGKSAEKKAGVGETKSDNRKPKPTNQPPKPKAK